MNAPAHRPNRGYADEFVRDISVQVLIAFYNERQGLLRDRIMKDPDYVDKIRTKAQYMDSTVRRWLEILDLVPRSQKGYKAEVMFRVWCLGLEPSWGTKRLAAHPDMEARLREQMVKHFTEEWWRVACVRWVDAIKRVRTDTCLTLNVPSLLVPDDHEDDFL